MLFKPREVLNLKELAVFLHRFVPRELGLRLRPGLLGRMPAWKRIFRTYITRDLGCYYKTDVAFAKFGKAHRVVTAVGFICKTFFALADLTDRFPEIPVPFHGIHAQIEVGIN